mmetsp:Transcript_15109/g.38854  ORF Transcript_15109/g.38854 Transcript_15109/m.38854 type:complete len:282 (-) Transcript_15109:1499-2344(-)
MSMERVTPAVGMDASATVTSSALPPSSASYTGAGEEQASKHSAAMSMSSTSSVNASSLSRSAYMPSPLATCADTATWRSPVAMPSCRTPKASGFQTDAPSTQSSRVMNTRVPMASPPSRNSTSTSSASGCVARDTCTSTESPSVTVDGASKRSPATSLSTRDTVTGCSGTVCSCGSSVLSASWRTAPVSPCAIPSRSAVTWNTACRTEAPGKTVDDAGVSCRRLVGSVQERKTGCVGCAARATITLCAWPPSVTASTVGLMSRSALSASSSVSSATVAMPE